MRASSVREIPALLQQTLRVTIQILLLRGGPQDLPSSWRLVYGLAGAYLLMNTLVLSLGLSQAQALLHAVAVTAVLALYTRWLLTRARLEVRYAQTLTALFATGILLGLAALPCMIELQPFLEQLRTLGKDDPLPPAPALAMFGYMAFSLWHLLAMAQIYRHAMDTTLGRGALLAVVYELLLLLIIRLTSGLTATAA